VADIHALKCTDNLQLYTIYLPGLTHVHNNANILRVLYDAGNILNTIDVFCSSKLVS
jgi:hypothetical protein